MATCLVNLGETFLDNQATPVDESGTWYFQGYNASSPTGPWSNLGGFNIGMLLGGYNYSLNIELPGLVEGGFFRFEYKISSPACSDVSSYHTLEILPLCSRRTSNGIPFASLDLCFDPAIGFPATLDLSEVMTSSPTGWTIENSNLTTPTNTALCPDYPNMIPGTWSLLPGSNPPTSSTVVIGNVVNLVAIMDDPQGPVGGSAGTYNFRFDPDTSAPFDDSDPNACDRCYAQVALTIENKGNLQLINPPYGTVTNPVIPGDGIGANENTNFLQWNQIVDLSDGALNHIYYGEGPDISSPAPGLITSIDSSVVINAEDSSVIQTPLVAGDLSSGGTTNGTRLFRDYGVGPPSPLNTGTGINVVDLPGGLHAFYVCVNNNEFTADCNSCATVYVDSSSAGPPFAMSTSIVEEQCTGANDGSITITSVSGGVAPYEFSLNGGAYQSGTLPFTFSNLSPSTYSVTVRDSVPNTTYTVNDLVVDAAIPLNLSTSVSNVDPLNQTYSLQQSATGGNPPYEYSDLTVNNGGTSYTSQDTYDNLQSDVIYTIGVRDSNGCILTDSFSYSTSDPITAVTASTFPVICNGDSTGSIEVTGVTGGVPPYEYRLNSGTWQSSTTFGNLSVGTYTLEVRDALGEVFTAPSNYQVTQPSPVNLTAVISGANIVLFPSGGNVQDGSYEYSDDGVNWVLNNSFPNPLVDGTYTYYTRDDNGCIATDEVTIVSNPITDASVTTQPVCLPNPGRIVFDADNVVGGTAPYQFSIDGGVTYGTSEVYLVNGGTYDCWVIDSIGVTYNIGNAVVEQAASELSISVSETGPGEVTVLVVGGQAPYEYNSNSTNLVPGGGWTTDPVFTGLTEGNTYYFFVRDSYGCIESAPITIAAVNQADMYVFVTSDKTTAEQLADVEVTLSVNGTTLLNKDSIWTVGQTLTAANYDTIAADSGNSVQACTVIVDALNAANTNPNISFSVSPKSSIYDSGIGTNLEELRHIRITWSGNVTWIVSVIDPFAPPTGYFGPNPADSSGTVIPDRDSQETLAILSTPGGGFADINGILRLPAGAFIEERDLKTHYPDFDVGFTTTSNTPLGLVP